ncbi:hypothetical protein [Nitrogeniibacter aestuarii]|uniref:hypothetical protein n=1 Tax=Nitrogeniibacter aestuarii TaxID=2815343 RepID=UPI001E45BF9A|nr:hypothetical protein [Nitrogeniibacter aestuarii]
MKYLLGILLPCALQALIVFVIIEANTGNGSWLGLAALLLGMFAIPATAVVNGIYLYSVKDTAGAGAILRCWAIATIVPLLSLLLMMFG